MSAFYEGTVRHRRFEPMRHEFSYPIFMAYLDLGELPAALDGLPFFSARRRAPVRFHRSDFMGDDATALDEVARQTVAAETGERPAGPVRLLTGLRHFGHSFNPVSFYYCFDPSGERVEAVIADVKNIPWGERHPYVLARGEAVGPVLSGGFEKALHVSPLMGMGHSYGLRTTEPGATASIHIDSRAGEKAFDATLSLERRELTKANARRLALRYPLMSLRVVGGIYTQALRLRLKGAKIHPHPRGAKPKGFIAP